MYYPVGRFGGQTLTIPSTIWNPLDANNVTLSDFNYTLVVDTDTSTIRANAGWDNVEIDSGLIYWEVIVDNCPTDGVNPAMSLGMRSAFDPMARDIANPDLSGAYEDRELRFNSDGGGSVVTTTIPDIAVWHSNPGTAPHTVHDVIEVAGNYFTCDPTGVPFIYPGMIARFAFNRTTGNMWLGDQDGWFNGGDPEGGTNPQFSNMDCSEAQYFGDEIFWRFFLATTSRDYSSDPIRVHLATGNNIFPQEFAAPVGFTALIDPASVDTIGNVWRYRDSSGDFMTVTPFLANTACWFGGGTIALGGGNNFAFSGGRAKLGKQYYFEMESVIGSTGPQVYLGVALLSDPGTGFPNNGTVCLWNQDGSLHDGAASIIIDATGVSGWNAAGSTNRLMFALSLILGMLWIGKDGTWFNGGDPENGINPQFSNLPLTGDWIGKAVIASNARETDYMVSPAHYLHPTPVGFTTTIPLIETWVAP